MFSGAEVRDRLGVPRGQSRGPLEIVILSTRARSAVMRARGAIRAARATSDPGVQLMWETLAQNLYAVEEGIAQRVLPALEARGAFSVIGPGTVAPLALEEPPGFARFLGRRLPLLRVIELKISFDPETEEGLRVVIAQAREVEHYFKARARG